MGKDAPKCFYRNLLSQTNNSHFLPYCHCHSCEGRGKQLNCQTVPQSEQQGALGRWNVMEQSVASGRLDFHQLSFSFWESKGLPLMNVLACTLTYSHAHICVCAPARCHLTTQASSTLGPGVSSDLVSRTPRTFCNLSLCL